jgi:hypothetical protein
MDSIMTDLLFLLPSKERNFRWQQLTCSYPSDFITHPHSLASAHPQSAGGIPLMGQPLSWAHSILLNLLYSESPHWVDALYMLADPSSLALVSQPWSSSVYLHPNTFGLDLSTTRHYLKVLNHGGKLGHLASPLAQYSGKK